MWLDGVFSHNEALAWSLEARELQLGQFSGSYSIISFPRFQRLQASNFSPPLLSAPDLFHNCVLINPSDNLHCR